MISGILAIAGSLGSVADAIRGKIETKENIKETKEIKE